MKISYEQIISGIIACESEVQAMTEENINNKLLLSALLSKNMNKNNLNIAEEFQNNFISNDELIKDLKTDITTLTRNTQSNPGNIIENIERLEQIKQRIRILQFDCWQLKYKFKNYLSGYAK
ncbi:hypothetical protein [Pollutibacter soli]|uniref:hypothetical protein n=1 Tax=Pollutibacter soli TaxID=3034157 RepID=UPI003013373B